ncbi:uncharacterized protein JCM10292_005501 [Rhodotorula paludigena]|uniref:uncharacterized protein n=1 Tax=Rhodotorula paludigena TaxID=86838 RepID=UPI00316C7CB3
MAGAGGDSTPLALRRWQDFHTACWGHPSGAVLEGIPFLVGSMGYFVGPVLLERIKDDKTARTNLVVFGSPGIGKSSFLPFLVARCLEQRRPVVFHKTGDPRAVILDNIGARFVDLLFLPDTRFDQTPVIAVDSVAVEPPVSVLFEILNAVTVVAASPRSARHRPFVKSDGDTFYWTIPPPGATEINNVARLRELRAVTDSEHNPVWLFDMRPGSEHGGYVVTGGVAFSHGDLSMDQPEESEQPPDGYKDLAYRARTFRVRTNGYYERDELVKILPPNFRYQLRAHYRKTNDILRDLFEDVAKSRLALTKDVLRAAASGSVELPESSQWTGFHRLITLLPVADAQPSLDFPSCDIVIASPLAQEVVRVAVSAMQLQDQLEMARLFEHEPMIEGILYEVTSFRLLGIRDDVNVEFISGEPSISIPAGLTRHKCDPDTSRLPVKTGVYILPVCFPSADAIVVLSETNTVILVQATVADEHAVKADGIRRICSSFPPEFSPRLVFAFLGPDRTTVQKLAKTPRPTLTNVSPGVYTFERGYIALSLDDEE